MAAQAREQGRYLGGRPPYGYRLADAGPHPNRAHAAWGRRAYRLDPDPQAAPVVRWIFAQRRAGHSIARITRALNDAGIPCPSAADPGRNAHRSGQAWMLTTVRAILANPRYTGRQVWNRQPTAMDLIDPAEYRGRAPAGAAGGLPKGWVISARPSHPALVSEQDFVAVQGTRAARYELHDAYLDAIAREMRNEYLAINKAGLVLQIDAPDLAMDRTMMYRDLSDADFVKRCERHVAAINKGIEGIPRDRVRLHVCYGNWEGPHIHDVALDKICRRSTKPRSARCRSNSPIRGMPRYAALKRVPFPKDMILIPGVVEMMSNFVEHRSGGTAYRGGGLDHRRPRARHRLDRSRFGTFTRREWVIEPVVWLELKAIRQGADIASARLAGRRGTPRAWLASSAPPAI